MQCILYKIYFWKVFHMHYNLICILYALLCGQKFYSYKKWLLQYLSVVIHHHMGVTMELSTPMLRCGKVVSIGPPCKSFVRRCSQYQRHENINTRDVMPLILNLHIDIFDVWGINFMGPFPNSEGCEYISVVVGYVSKWVKTIPCWAANAMYSKKMFHKVIFSRNGVPRIVISDGGSHFIDRTFQKALSEVGVDHWIAIPYHP
jgi:hypothetical protein